MPGGLFAASLPALKVSDNHRFLITEDGKPFFWLGDTAWELFHRLTREEAALYLKRRAEQGFTVIQASVLAEIDGLNTPNAYGHKPLAGNDPAKPDEDYFKHVDWIVEKANSLGMYVAMLPTWGTYWQRNEGPFNAENARIYSEWLGRRYKETGIVWVLGGDRKVDTETHRAILQGMVAGLRAGDGGAHLKTFHPAGGTSSSKWFHDHDADWLDFNMIQSGHSVTNTNYVMVQRDYALTPAKPCLDGEPTYEYPPNAMPEKRPAGAIQIRRNAYWALFAGAHGHTYGTHPIWQMYAPPHLPKWEVNTPWYEALDLPGANQLKHLKALILSRPFLARIPDQQLILEGQGEGLAQIQATRDGNFEKNDADYVMVYFPEARRVTIQTEKIAAKALRGWWFNPRNGEVTALGTVPNTLKATFEPPTRGKDEDWVLVLDDAGKSYPAPGTPMPSVSTQE